MGNCVVSKFKADYNDSNLKIFKTIVIGFNNKEVSSNSRIAFATSSPISAKLEGTTFTDSSTNKENLSNPTLYLTIADVNAKMLVSPKYNITGALSFINLGTLIYLDLEDLSFAENTLNELYASGNVIGTTELINQKFSSMTDLRIVNSQNFSGDFKRLALPYMKSIYIANTPNVTGSVEEFAEVMKSYSIVSKTIQITTNGTISCKGSTEQRNVSIVFDAQGDYTIS